MPHSREQKTAYYASPRGKAWQGAHQRRVARGEWTEEMYHRRLVEQCGKCALCWQPMMGKWDAVRDHCHATGRARGLLHNACNRLIETVEAMGGAVDVSHYLAT